MKLYLCDRLKDLSTKVEKYQDLEDEMLYGRAGLLFAFLFVRQHLGSKVISDDVVGSVIFLFFKLN